MFTLDTIYRIGLFIAAFSIGTISFAVAFNKMNPRVLMRATWGWVIGLTIDFIGEMLAGKPFIYPLLSGVCLAYAVKVLVKVLPAYRYWKSKQDENTKGQ